MLICDAIIDEIVEKLVAYQIDRETIETFIALLDGLAEWVDVPEEAVEPLLPGDSDDDVVIACAVRGGADFLVTYDPHFMPLGDMYKGVRITKALPFFWAVRGDQAPD